MASGPLKGDGVSKAKRKLSNSGKKILKRSKPTIATKQKKPIALASPSNSLESEVNQHMLKINLDSISKLEVRNLKRKLEAELDELRSFMKQQETPVANKKVKTANDEKAKVQILNSCKSLVTKLMKRKFGNIFSAPVDAAKLGLYDYHAIVKKPMDLGTVKTKLTKGSYKSPLEFAADVRLTFNNAMLYNPKGHQVHGLAEEFLKLFEEQWAPLQTQYDLLNRIQPPARDIDPPVIRNINRNRNRPYVEPIPSPETAPILSPPSPAVVENRTLERAESMTNPMEPAVLNASPEKPQEEDDSRPRDLTIDEKRRLSEDLQDLPFDKLEAVVQIVKNGDPEIAQEDDEIELDIETISLETLWELFRFVTQYKESSNRRNEEQRLGSERDAESCQNPNTLETGPESLKGTESGHVASSLRQEVNGDGSSSSSSSSSGSGSCSSDSDSDSSGHGSDTGN